MGKYTCETRTLLPTDYEKLIESKCQQKGTQSNAAPNHRREHCLLLTDNTGLSPAAVSALQRRPHHADIARCIERVVNAPTTQIPGHYPKQRSLYFQ
jgi:hypothetical protein